MSNQPIEVVTLSGQQSEFTPVSFTWQGQTYIIEDIGRRWTDILGEHILVLTHQKHTYELILNPDRTTWFLNIGKAPPLMM